MKAEPAANIVQPISSHVLLAGDFIAIVSTLLITQSAWIGLMAALGLRGAALLTALANEWAHLIVATLMGRIRGVWSYRNLAGNRPFSVHAAALLPFSLDRRGDLWVEIPGLTLQGAQRVRVLGFWLSACATLATLGATWSAAWEPARLCIAAACAAGSGASLLACAFTDLSPLSAYAASRSRMGCGNLTLLGRLLPGETTAMPARVVDVLQRMLHVTQLRGAQSGGGALQVEAGGQPRQVIHKCLNAKRADLSKGLTGALARAAGALPARATRSSYRHTYASRRRGRRLETSPIPFATSKPGCTDRAGYFGPTSSSAPLCYAR